LNAPRDASKVTAVLLPDQRWHLVKPGTFVIKLDPTGAYPAWFEFEERHGTLSGLDACRCGPMSSALAFAMEEL
jgi:hypothetical protein